MPRETKLILVLIDSYSQTQYLREKGLKDAKLIKASSDERDHHLQGAHDVPVQLNHVCGSIRVAVPKGSGAYYDLPVVLEVPDCSIKGMRRKPTVYNSKEDIPDVIQYNI
jgi:hypothetical protein